jgi:hypothetical protein
MENGKVFFNSGISRPCFFEPATFSGRFFAQRAETSPSVFIRRCDSSARNYSWLICLLRLHTFLRWRFTLPSRVWSGWPLLLSQFRNAHEALPRRLQPVWQARFPEFSYCKCFVHHPSLCCCWQLRAFPISGSHRIFLSLLSHCPLSAFLSLHPCWVFMLAGELLGRLQQGVPVVRFWRPTWFYVQWWDFFGSGCPFSIGYYDTEPLAGLSANRAARVSKRFSISGVGSITAC